MRIALVTHRALPELDPDDRPLVGAFASLGAHAEPAIWDDPRVDWGSYDAAFLRSPWDYFHRRAEFLAWTDATARRTRFWNPPAVIAWNTHKGYLTELGERGAPVVPTILLRRGESAGLVALLASRGWERAVLKPAVACDSHGALAVGTANLAAGQAHLEAIVGEGDLLIQPYLPSVDEPGERCLVFLDGAYSHAVRKNSLARGGRWAGLPEGVPVEPAADERAAADRVLALCGFADLLYARVDLLRGPAGEPLLLELELTEPTLFLRDRPGAAERVAAALLARVAA